MGYHAERGNQKNTSVRSVFPVVKYVTMNWLNRIDSLIPGRCPLCQIEINPVSNQADFCQKCLPLLPTTNQACQQCGIPLKRDDICGTCLSSPPSFDRTFTPFLYTLPVSRLIQELKFSARIRLAKPLSKLLCQHLLETKPDSMPDILIPVPLHPKRLSARGLNQSHIIATALSEYLNIPVDTSLVIKSRQTVPQSSLNRKERQKNIRGAFTLSRQPSYQHIGLVDDVITTGSTIEEVSKLFKKNGVNTISVYAIARALNATNL